MDTSSSVPVVLPDAPQQNIPLPRKHLLFLDGLRGVAALYIVTYHILQVFFLRSEPLYDPTLPPMLTSLISLAKYGHYSVVVFIVLSGYVLMLPVARSADKNKPFDFREFIKRRARRIIPSYYAAVVFTYVLTVLTSHRLHVISRGDWVCHILLIHNFVEKYNMSLAAPFWSVALEWEIYFAFPLVLLPIWRRMGLAGVLGAAILISIVPHFLLPPARNLDWTYPWMLVAFTSGMIGAVLTQGALASVRFAVAAIVCAVAGLMDWGGSNLLLAHDCCIAAATMCFIVYGATTTTRSWIFALLNHRYAIALGKFSYSLYLTHWATMSVITHFIEADHVTGLPNLVIRLLTIVLCVCVAYLFYLACERPFTQSARKP